MNQIGLDILPEATGANSDSGPNLPYSCSFVLTGSIPNVLRIDIFFPSQSKSDVLYSKCVGQM